MFIFIGIVNMKIITLLSTALYSLVLCHSAIATPQQHGDALEGTDQATSSPRGGWYCDHWPESCNEVCESGSSPWGPYQICRLRPPWDPVSSSDNPYEFVGRAHNQALERVGAKASFVKLDQRLATSHMIQLSAEYLCDTGVPLKKSTTGSDDISLANKKARVEKGECIFRYAGIATQVMNDLRQVVYLDGDVEERVKGYQQALKQSGKFSVVQLQAIVDLYKLLPDDEDIDNLPYLFEKIDTFDRYISAQMSAQDAEVVLLGSSVMRASLDYWLNQLDGPSNWITIGENDSDPVARRRGLFRKILTLIAADAGGCLGGAVIIPGVPGCVIGAVGASAGAGAALD